MASFCIFLGFSSKQNNFYNKKSMKNDHLVSGAGIQTHDLLIMSILPYPLDQDSSLTNSLSCPFMGTIFTLSDISSKFPTVLSENKSYDKFSGIIIDFSLPTAGTVYFNESKVEIRMKHDFVRFCAIMKHCIEIKYPMDQNFTQKKKEKKVIRD